MSAHGCNAPCRLHLTLAETDLPDDMAGKLGSWLCATRSNVPSENHRSRRSKLGLARFEVLGRPADRDLIRPLARRLAEDGPEASCWRAASIAGEPPTKGGILAALRRAPLVGADLNRSRAQEEGRRVEL